MCSDRMIESLMRDRERERERVELTYIYLYIYIYLLNSLIKRLLINGLKLSVHSSLFFV